MMVAANVKTAVYVSNADSGDIWVLHLDAERGELAPVQRMMVGGNVMPLALAPGHRHLYAARRSDPLEVLSFSIDAHSGHLRRIGEAPLPHSMAYIATDRSGRFLFSASYGGDQIAVSPIDAHGVVLPSAQVLSTPPKAHAIQADPSNRSVLAACLGGSVLLSFRFDASTGRIEARSPPEFHPHPGASPRHFAFAKDRARVYLLNELDASIDVLAFDAGTGALSTLQTISSLPPGFDGEAWAADLHLTPDGRFLFASERHSSTLAAFRIDAESGRLEPIGHTPTEAQPRGFQITADGRFLLAAGQGSHRVSVYAIDARTGELGKRSDCAVGRNPNWIETVTLDG
jgi:6-phosphogluconolactonase